MATVQNPPGQNHLGLNPFFATVERSVRVRTPSCGSDRVRNVGHCQFSPSDSVRKQQKLGLRPWGFYRRGFDPD